MSQKGRRILLAVEPGVLAGALAEILTATGPDEVVRITRAGHASAGGEYDAAVVCIDLPDGVRSRVVITLPDRRGSAGTGSVREGDLVREVSIEGPEEVIDLLNEYAPRRSGP